MIVRQFGLTYLKLADMTTTAFETETDQHVLTQEILRVTGIIKVNFPKLYATLYETPSFNAFEEEHMETEQFENYLSFLQSQLSLYRSAYVRN